MKNQYMNKGSHELIRILVQNINVTTFTEKVMKNNILHFY